MKITSYWRRPGSLRPYGTGSAPSSICAWGYRPRQWSSRFVAWSVAHLLLLGRQTLAFQRLLVVRLLCAALAFPLLALLWFGHRSGYDYVGYLIERQLEGRPVEHCLDLPEKYWMRIPKCYDYDFPAEGKPPGLGGVDSSDV